MMFSIIVPTFNRSHIISNCIISVISQSFTDFELIIVDDGSNDDTKKIVDSFNDYRIKYFYIENNGVCNARNYGVKYSSGEYILFLDSDDEVSNTWLEDFYKLIYTDIFDVLFCSFVSVSRLKKNKIFYSKKKLRKSQIPGNYIPGSFCIKRNIFSTLNGYDTLIKYGENTELSFRLNQLNIKYGFIDNVNLFYNQSEFGGSKNWNNKLESNLYVLKKHKLYFEENKRVKSLYLSVAAFACLNLNKKKLSRKLYISAFLSNPFRLRIIFNYLKTFI